MENNENKGGAFEFTFDDPAMTGGLVFERETPTVQNASPEKSESSSEAPLEQATPPKNREEKASPSTATPKAPEDGEEFGIPETFTVNEKYNTPVRDNERTRIYTTYVPRFTEVSETYRMKNDPRPRPVTPEPKVTVTEEPVQPRVSAKELAELPKPTPVSSFSDDEVVLINVSEPMPDTEGEGDVSIFKFEGAEEERDPDSMNVEEENANRRALNELRARQAERRAREEEERRAAEEAEQRAREAIRNTKLAPEDYEIPDPEKTGFIGSGARRNSDADYDTPHGIPKGDDGAKKFKSSEYTSAGQRDAFKDKFLDSLVAFKIRIAALVLVAIVAISLENSSLFGINIEKILGIDYMPSALAIIDFQLVISALLLTLPETIKAVKALIGGKVVSALVLPLSFVVLFAYTVVIAASKYYIAYPVFGFVFIAEALAVLVASYLQRKTQFENFKFISVKGEKRIVEWEETRRYPRTMLALDGAVDGYKSNMARTFRTTFVSDFFENSGKSTVNSKNNLIMLSVAFGAALVSALVTFFVTEKNPLPAALAVLAVITAFAVPAIAIISRSFAYYYAGNETRSEGSTLIGEAAYSDTASIDVISFEDTEIFGEDDVNLKRFGFYGDEDNMNKSMRLIASLFASVGGPLHTIFSKMLEKRCTPATDPQIEDDGIMANVDGKEVLAGTAEYMLRHGIEIPEDNERAYGGFGAESMKTIYGAEGGVIFAKFYIRYSFSEEFTSLLPALREEHIVPLVYTSDPNISNELLKTLTVGGDCMRVIKRKIPALSLDKAYPRLSATAVTGGDKIDAIKLILTARKYKRFTEKAEKAELIALGVGTSALAILSVTGLVGAVPTLVLGGVKLLSALVLGLVSKKRFNINKGNE